MTVVEVELSSNGGGMPPFEGSSSLTTTETLAAGLPLRFCISENKQTSVSIFQNAI